MDARTIETDEGYFSRPAGAPDIFDWRISPHWSTKLEQFLFGCGMPRNRVQLFLSAFGSAKQGLCGMDFSMVMALQWRSGSKCIFPGNTLRSSLSYVKAGNCGCDIDSECENRHYYCSSREIRRHIMLHGGTIGP